MSQLWHAHWAEDSFKPTRIGNWQVPNWHPKFPCDRHCVTTKFLADRSGRILPDQPRPKRSPWGGFKGTWELPLKIDRNLARMLSAPPRYAQAAWEAHKMHYNGPCATKPTIPKKIAATGQKNLKKTADAGKTKFIGIGERNLRGSHRKKPEKNVIQPKRIENVNREKREEEEKGVGQKREAENVNREDRGVDEKKFSQERTIEAVGQLDPGEREEEKTSKCLCAHEKVTPKAIGENICAIHRRLRV